MLQEGQVQIRDLILGPGTPYRLRDFNPFKRNVRADQGGPRAWNDGSWSGAEFLDENVIPLTIFVKGDDRTPGSWLSRHFELIQALDAVRDGVSDVELRFRLGGVEYLMFGRPRMVDPNVEIIGTGQAFVEAAFVANDPHMYSAEENSVVLTLPKYSSGLAVPLTVPLRIQATKVNGADKIANQGISVSDLNIRIDGPVEFPSVSVVDEDNNSETLQVTLNLLDNQWIVIDTASRSVLLNGLANRRNQVSGQFPKLKPGISDVFFNSSRFNEVAKLTIRWRYAW